jgi:hypothetical protein
MLAKIHSLQTSQRSQPAPSPVLIAQSQLPAPNDQRRNRTMLLSRLQR